MYHLEVDYGVHLEYLHLLVCCSFVTNIEEDPTTYSSSCDT
jgi:hypothetical protein